MKPQELIEAYVSDVAVQLPRRQRDDVAFELRALLQEELQARATAAGHEADEAVTLELLRSFGRPADVAARYRPAVTIIDPADGSAFLRTTIIGMVVILGAGLVAPLRRAGEPGASALTLLGQWWTGAVLPSFWWPGVLVTGFAWAAWSRRRWPPVSTWQPRAADRIRGGRVVLAAGLAGIVVGMAVLVDPSRALDLVWGDGLAPAAREALTYAEPFVHGEGLVLLGLVALNVPLLLAVLASGRWSPRLRRLDSALALATCAAMLWACADGPILLTARGDRAAKFLMALIAVSVLGHQAFEAYRRVRPGPAVATRG